MLKMVLADKQAIFRAGIAKVLGVEDEIRIVAQVQSGDQLLPSLDKFHPNVLAFATNLVSNPAELVEAADRVKTRLIALAETGENTGTLLGAGIHGVVFRSV